MQLFYSNQINNNQIVFDGDESKHLMVLRKQVHDEIKVIDGNGYLYDCFITAISKKEIRAEIQHSRKETYPWESIQIFISPTKNLDRMEWMVEKLTEIGVGKIGFMVTENSERKVLKLERLQKKVIAASKQSLKSKFPELIELQSFKDVVQVNGQVKCIAHCMNNNTRTDLMEMAMSNENLVMLIGPEGDFTEQEVTLAMAKGFVPVSLGSSRLRTETAAVVSATLINSKLN